MADNFNFFLRKNGFLLFFILFIISILFILLVNGWISSQIDERTEEKGVEQSFSEKVDNRFNPAKEPEVTRERVSPRQASFEGSEPEEQSSQAQDKKMQEIPIDSKILIQ